MPRDIDTVINCTAPVKARPLLKYRRIQKIWLITEAVPAHAGGSVAVLLNTGRDFAVEITLVQLPEERPGVRGVTTAGDGNSDRAGDRV